MPSSPIEDVLVADGSLPFEAVPHPAGAGRHVVRFASEDVAKHDLPARLHLACGWPRPGRVWLVEPLEVVAGDLADYRVALVPHHDGVLRVVPHVPALFVDEVEFAESRVTVTGRTHQVDRFSLTLTGPRARSSSVEVTARDGRFTAVLPTTVTTWEGTSLPVPANVYRLTAHAGEHAFVARAGRLADETCLPPRAHGWTVEVTERRVVTLRRAVASEPGSLSAYAQQLLRTRCYEPARSGPRSETGLFECFGGALCGDSPRAVFELLRELRPDLDLVWSVKDLAVPVPAGGRAVLQHTPEWWQLLGSARYLVNNANFLPRFRKAPGQVYLQTWHGTPLSGSAWTSRTRRTSVTAISG